VHNMKKDCSGSGSARQLFCSISYSHSSTVQCEVLPACMVAYF
jgi:hypothetical protein